MSAPSAQSPRSILVINANSSQSMTDGLSTLLSHHTSPNVTFSFFTAPSTAPNSINNEDDGEKSTLHCIPKLTEDVLSGHDGFVVACYSRHTLEDWLKAQPVIKLHSKPVFGIFQASVLRSIAMLGQGQKYGIVSTGKYWEKALSDGVEAMENDSAHALFAGVETTGLTASELHDMPQTVVSDRMAEATKRLLRKGSIGVICLGCAGMAGMDQVVHAAAEQELGVERASQLHVMDGVVAAVELIRASFA